MEQKCSSACWQQQERLYYWQNSVVHFRTRVMAMSIERSSRVMSRARPLLKKTYMVRQIDMIAKESVQKITTWAEKNLMKSVVPHFTQRVSHKIRPNFSGWYQMSPENFQSWRLHSLSRQPAPMLIFMMKSFSLYPTWTWTDSVYDLCHSLSVYLHEEHCSISLMPSLHRGLLLKPSKAAPSPGWTSLAVWPPPTASTTALTILAVFSWTCPKALTFFLYWGRHNWKQHCSET